MDKRLIPTIYKEITQLNNKNQYDFKMHRGTKLPFFQRRHLNGQQIHVMMFNITDYQGNANQNHNEISAHNCH